MCASITDKYFTNKYSVIFFYDGDGLNTVTNSPVGAMHENRLLMMFLAVLEIHLTTFMNKQTEVEI